MDFSYDGMEDAIVAYLQPLIVNADVKPMPENDSEFKLPVEKALITIAYGGSDFNPTRSTNEVSQEELVNLMVNIRSMNLRGETGIYSIIGLVKSSLLGVRFFPNDRLILKDTQLEQRDEQKKFWSYTVTFTAKKLVVQTVRDDDINGPLLKQVNFLDNPIPVVYNQ